jgi:hypothetical protein
MDKPKLVSILAQYSPPLSPTQIKVLADGVLAELKKETELPKEAKPKSKSRSK